MTFKRSQRVWARQLDGPAFSHRTVDHAERYVDGRVHTNGIENFWSLLKRGLHEPTSASRRSTYSATSTSACSRSTRAA
jgi:hypothetical protein